jgi:hypothetical protein
MDEKSSQSQWESHTRDEGRALEKQQSEAGPTHGPVGETVGERLQVGAESAADIERLRCANIAARWSEPPTFLGVTGPLDAPAARAVQRVVREIEAEIRGGATPMSLAPGGAAPQVEPLLLTTVQISTFLGPGLLTRASGFFFERSGQLFLVTSRHVLFDEASRHLPDQIEIEVHSTADNLARTSPVRLPLYRDGRAAWRQARDGGGDVDVAAIELERGMLPPSAVLSAFTPEHLLQSLELVEVGTPLLLLGFPLGFHDVLHHLPVVRHAIIASSFGLRFQGQGYFLTDARAHRGSSGGPIVMRSSADRSLHAWKLLGVHSSGFDMGDRDRVQDDMLGLNNAWYADILMTLTEPVSR